jgi:hypothetical protein
MSEDGRCSTTFCWQEMEDEYGRKRPLSVRSLGRKVGLLPC